MSKIDDLKAELTSKGIEFPEDATVKELKALLPEASEEGDGEESDSDEIVVKDPQELRPKQLPLVVILPKGASKAQIAFAKVLNGYAYKNPKKWNEKKDDQKLANGRVIPGLISQLKALKDAPDPVENAPGEVVYKNKLLEE